MGLKSFKCPECGRAFNQNVDEEFLGDVFCPFCSTKVYSYVMASPKRYSVTLILAIFLGLIGAHRFYVGKYFTGVLYILTLGFCGIGWIFDIYRIVTKKFKAKDTGIVCKG